MKIIKLLTVLLLLTSGAIAQQSGQKSYTLQECIDYALENNAEIVNANYEKEIAETQIGETLSQGLPQVNATANLNYNFEPQKSIIDISTFDPSVPEGTEQQVSFQQKYDGNISISAKQLLFDGSFFVGLQASRTYKELSTKQHIKTQIDVVEAVSKAYYNALVTQERLALVEVNFNRIDSLLRDTQAMYDNGFVEKIDVSRLKVQYNNVKVQLDQIDELNKLSTDLLKFQMGMPISMEIELEDKLEEVTFDTISKSDFDYTERIEYSQLQTNLSLVNLDMKNNRVKYIPTLYANLAYGYNTAAASSSDWFNGSRWLNFGYLGATLSMPIFDGFLKSNKIQKNKIQAKQIMTSFEQLENAIDLEVSQAKINMENAVDNMVAQKENMELAEEIYNVTKLKYQEGVGSNLEVIEADADFKESQTNYYNALFDALIAKVELEKAYGQLLK